MILRSIFFIFTLFLAGPELSAKAQGNKNSSFLLHPNETTSFMDFEFHKLALEAAKKKNFEESFRIYLKVAKKGDNIAEYNVGMMYMKGLGVEAKKMDAYKWLRRASKHGNKEAALYFKQMNERYEQKHQEKSRSNKSEAIKKKYAPKVQKATKVSEKNITRPKNEIEKREEKPLSLSPSQKNSEPQKNSYLVYILSVLVLIIIAIVFFFLKKSPSKEKEISAPQGAKTYKTQMYEITYEHISKYHGELLKQVKISAYRSDKKKMQIYYMFLAGVIDYFCQLEEFSESEQRRIFNTHMGEEEGKENLTAITQAILEGQRDHSMYHYQAAGGISAKEWHQKHSKDALSMLKKVLAEKRD